MARKTQREYNQAYYAKHREQLRTYAKTYRDARKATPEYRERNKASKLRYRRKNADRLRTAGRLYYSKNKSRAKLTSLWTLYRLTGEEYDALQDRCSGRCLICDRSAKLDVDHDHNTGVVRGLLCRGCNPKLGWFERNRDKVLEYLSATTTTQIVCNKPVNVFTES